MPDNINFNDSPTNYDLLRRFSPFIFSQRADEQNPDPNVEPEYSTALRPHLTESTPLTPYQPSTNYDAPAESRAFQSRFASGLPELTDYQGKLQTEQNLAAQRPIAGDPRFKPSLARTIGSALAGGAVAYAGGGRPQSVEEGVNIVRGGLSEPYRKALNVWQPQMDAAREATTQAGRLYELGRQRTMDESTLQERGELSRYRAAEAKRLEDALDTPAKRATYLQQNPEQFKELSDFERNDYLLTGKYPQREPQQNTPEAAWNSSFGAYEKAIKSGDTAGSARAKQEMDALVPFVEQSKGFGKRDTSPTEWQAYLQKAGGDPTRAIAFKNADEIARARAGRGGLSETEKNRQAAQVEDTITDALARSGNDPDKAIGLINGSRKIPSELKARMRERVRERVRPGQPKKRGGLFDDEDEQQ